MGRGNFVRKDLPSWLGDCGQLILNPVDIKRRAKKNKQTKRKTWRTDMCTQRGRGDGRNGKSSTDTYTPPRVKELASGKLPSRTGSSARGSVRARGVGWGEGQEGGETGIHAADSSCCTAKT